MLHLHLHFWKAYKVWLCKKLNNQCHHVSLIGMWGLWYANYIHKLVKWCKLLNCLYILLNYEWFYFHFSIDIFSAELFVWFQGQVILNHKFTFPYWFSALDEAMCRANKEEIYIPYGVGICGHVAKTKETINLKDAYEVVTYESIKNINR